MEQMYLDDLAHSTEIVLSARKVRPAVMPTRHAHLPRLAEGSARRAVTGLMRVGNTVGAAITSRRALGPAESVVLVSVAVLLLVLATVAILWPVAVTVPVVLFSAWLAASLLIRAYRLYRRRKAEAKPSD